MNLNSRLVHLARSQRSWLALAILMGLTGGVLVVVQAGVLSRVILDVYLHSDKLSAVFLYMLGLLAMYFLRAGTLWVSEVSAKKAAIKLKEGLRLHVFDSLLRSGPANTSRESTGELVNTITQGVESLDAYFSQYLPQAALAVLVPLSFLILIFPLDPLTGVIFLLTAPLIPLFMHLIGRLGESASRRQWSVLSRMSAFYLDLLQGLTTLKMLNRSQEQVRTIQRMNEGYRKVTMNVMRVTFLSALALELLATLGTAVVAVEIGLRLFYGRLTFEQALFILLLAPEFYLPLRTLGLRYHAGMAGVTAAGRVYQILDQVDGLAEKSRQNPESDDVLKQSIITNPPEIVFDGVSFAYSDERPALVGVSLTIPAGKKVALVGPSGSGKSTLASLLLRFIQPQSGNITINGQPLNSFSDSQWHAQSAWVPQLPHLFFGSVAENICLGKPEATHAQMVEAARLAQADEFIRSLPAEYDTPIGEQGVRLSGGEAQRIALARAFLLDAPLVILDEATANLDPLLEEQMRGSLQNLLAGKTALIIAHRLGTVMDTDHVVVMDQGRVVEQGNPKSLLATGGIFARMVKDHWDKSPPNAAGESSAAISQYNSGIEGKRIEGLGTGKEQVHPSASKKKAKSLGNMGVLKWLLKPLWRYKGQVALSVLLDTLTILSGVGLLAVSAYLISAAAVVSSIAELGVAIVSVRAFGISRGIFRYLERLVTHGMTFHMLGTLRLEFYRRLEPLAPARLMRYRGGDLLNRIVGDINGLENFYVRSVSPIVVALLIALISGAFLGSYYWGFTIVLWLIMALAGLAIPALMRWKSQEPGRQVVSYRAELAACLVDGIQGLPDLAAFNRIPKQVQTVCALSQKVGKCELRLAKLNALQSALMVVLANLALWGVLFLAIPLVSAGEIPGVLLASLALAALSSFEAFQPLPTAANNLETSLEAGRRLLDIVNSQPEVQEPEFPLAIPKRLDVEVTNLSFTYPDSIPGEAHPPVEGRLNRQAQNIQTALQGISFSLPEGKKLALVGASGSGKTTLINLVLRFWEYTSGEMRLDGSDLRLFNSHSWRHNIGVVSQRTHLFNASLRENLLLAKPRASEAELQSVVEKAQLMPWIESLPLGLETQVGEMGMRMSGGERQRLAIARALLKYPCLLILDEPTANLDVATERQVMEAILAAMTGRSVLMITHRLVGLEAMDEILVLSQGRIVERGTFADLLSQAGYFRRMWNLQKEMIIADD